MRVGLGQTNELTDDFLTFALQLGVTSVQVNTPSLPGDVRWEWDDIDRLARTARDRGCVLEAIENVPVRFYVDAMMGGERRDEQIENYRHIIRGVGRAGIPTLGFHWMPNSVWRTSRGAPGRGGAQATAFTQADLERASVDERRAFMPPMVGLPYSGKTLIDAASLWDNYVYFVRAVLPVAEESGVVLALHPDDPPAPMLGGVARIFSDVDGFVRAGELTDSPSWALDLCFGCCSEMPGGAANVTAMVERFGPRGRIRYVHFRDVQGTMPDGFQECFIGEGNYDPAAMLTLLYRSGFDGFIIDDHVPKMIDDSTYGHRARAHAVGYLQGMIAMLNSRKTSSLV